MLVLVTLIPFMFGKVIENPVDYKPLLNPSIHSNASNSLPSDFLWGYATAATQNEGSTNVDGKTDSIWDVFSRKSGKIVDGTSPEYGVDEYKRYTEIVELLKIAGANTYRMSIAWTRLVPGGFKNSPVNALAIKHYNNVFDLLLRNGITPMVTLYHFDMPAVLETKYKGFLNTDRFTEDYVYFAEQAFSAFGDRIKYWITFNEPITTCTAGYGIGEHAPGYNINPLKGDWSFTPLDLVRCGHTHLVAHAHAVNLYRTKFKSQNGKISMANNLSWGEPMSNDPEDVNATQNFLDANYGWFEDVLNFGDYPQSLKNFISVLLPKFSEEQKKLLKGSTDFIAVNHYTANYIGKWGYKGQGFEDGNPFMRFSRGFFDKNGNRLGNRGAPKWLFNAPWAFEKSLDYITKQYGNRDIYVTENGFSVFEEPWMSVELALKDTARVDYHHHYLAAMQRSISKGSKVKGYMAWTLIDNFEWAAGYTQPFGCTKFDRKTGKRWLKDSAYYLRDYFGLAITK